MEWIKVKDKLPPIGIDIILYSTRTDKAVSAYFTTEPSAIVYCEHYIYDYWIYAPKKEQDENE